MSPVAASGLFHRPLYRHVVPCLAAVKFSSTSAPPIALSCGSGHWALNAALSCSLGAANFFDITAGNLGR